MSAEQSAFQISLPSNASMKLYPENRANSYKTKLYKALDLSPSEDYEVALVDILYPQNWPNMFETTELTVIIERAEYANVVAGNQIEIEVGAEGEWSRDGNASATDAAVEGNPLSFSVHRGYYSTMTELGAHLLSQYRRAMEKFKTPDVGKLQFSFDGLSRRAELTCIPPVGVPAGYRISFQTETPYLMETIFGFKADDAPTREDGDTRPPPSNFKYTLPLVSARPCNFEILSSMFVYCNLVKYQMVGDTEAPLLGIVPLSNDPAHASSQQYYAFNPPYYIPLIRGHFDTIEIQLNTDFGAPFPFSDDDAANGAISKVLVRLAFRKRHGSGLPALNTIFL